MTRSNLSLRWDTLTISNHNSIIPAARMSTRAEICGQSQLVAQCETWMNMECSRSFAHIIPYQISLGCVSHDMFILLSVMMFYHRFCCLNTPCV